MMEGFICMAGVRRGSSSATPGKPTLFERSIGVPEEEVEEPLPQPPKEGDAAPPSE